ncbi:peptide ABC transporter substrate-binding protein [Mesorhizobium sp. M0757]|uniref:ABC transporter substrate-binding protein n=1 Tax=unclassified Mesorhizobium TaxID=325217 RepID=UPI003336BE4B
MHDWLVNRRALMKGLMLASTAPLVINTRAFASSCEDHIVRFGGIFAPDTMNPFASWGSFSALVSTYDFLVGVDAQRYPDRKGFAKSWSAADDNLTWTFKIWPGMKWSDGEPATARDAAFTYNYLQGSIGKPDELNAGWNNTEGLANIESITALDDETLRIVTKAPTRWALDNTTMIVPEHIWKNVSYAEARSTFRNDPPLVGTGPMILSEFQQGQFARFTANPYFRTGQPATAGMVLVFFSSYDPMAQALKSGDIDYGNVTAAQWDAFSKDSNIVVGQHGTESRAYLAFNTTSGQGKGNTKALQDRAFRDAIGYAIDQKAIVDRAYRGHADLGVGLVMPAAADYYSDLSDIRRHFDLAEAGRRLDAAGYQDRNGDGIREDREGNPFQLEMITGTLSGTDEIPTAVMQLIAGWLGQVGIPVSVTQLDSGALAARTKAPVDGGGDWDLLLAGNWPSPSPDGLLSLGKSGDYVNRSYWQDDQFEELLSHIAVTIELKKSQELVDRAARLVYTDAPYIMLCYPYVLEAHRNDCFEGWGSEDAISQWGYFPLDRLRPHNA